MAILVHRYDSPDRFVAGTVGQPGERTFFLQAREGNRITSVVVEKQQVSVLAEHLDKVLDEVLRRSGPAADVPPAQEKPSDFDPLDAPITEEFRVGTMTIAWDAEINKIVIELFSNVDDDDEAEDLGDDLDLPAGGRGRRAGRRPTRSMPTRCSWSRSAPRTPATSWLAPRRWSPPAGRRVPSACSRWIPPATCARAPTATGARCSEASMPNLPTTSAPNSETC